MDFSEDTLAMAKGHPINPSVLSRKALRLSVKAAAIVVMGIGLIGLLDCLSLSRTSRICGNWALIPANAAVCFILAGLAICLDCMTSPLGIRRTISRSLAAVVMLTGFLTRAEYALGVDLGIDVLLAQEPLTTIPSRMAPAVALIFFLTGLSLLLSRRLRLALWVASPAVVISGIAVLGYLISPGSIYLIRPFNGMSFLTATGLLALSLAVIATPLQRRGFHFHRGVVLENYPSMGTICLLLLVLSSSGLLIWRGLIQGWLDSRLALVLAVACGALLSAWPIGHFVRRLKRMESAWKGSQRALIDLNQDLEREVDARTAELNKINRQLTDNVVRYEHQATHDTLTGLPNRILLNDRITQAVAIANRRDGRSVIIFIDLDKFKFINDTLGHEAGDLLLKEISSRLVSCVRESDTVARLGGDEFVVLLHDELTDSDVTTLVQRLIEHIAQPMVLRGEERTVTCSIGISLFPDDGLDAKTLLQNADIAMYRAKDIGRNCFQYFTEEMNESLNRRLQMEVDLRQALANNEFELLYLPVIELAEGRIVGSETLIRWHHPQMGLISPGAFIPVSEESDLILQIGEWVIRRVCRQINDWSTVGVPLLPVSINLSTKQFERQDIPALIEHILAEFQVKSDLLEIEITESMSMQDPVRSIECIGRLRQMNVAVALDDFGTGYSNLSYLRSFPIRKLKLDSSFIADLTTNPEDAGMSTAIIEMAHSLNLLVVAEGVERVSQMTMLRARGCDQMQGYLFSPAISASDFAMLMLSGRRLVVDSINQVKKAATLLIVDDEKHVLAALRRELASQPYQVLQASHPNEAFEILATHEVDVVLVDHKMPKMTGLEFLEIVRKMYPHITRVAMSAATDFDILLMAINQGLVFKFLCKPWNSSELINAITDAFRHAAEVREHQAKQHHSRIFTLRCI